MALPPAEGEDFALIQDRARLALGLLSQHRIPPTPARFTVAYVHHAGEMPDLSLAVNRLVGHNKLTATAVDEIFDQFYGRQIEEAELRNASQQIERTVNEVVEYIDTATDTAQRYGSVLAEFTDKAREQAADIGSAVSNMLDETHRMAETNRSLEEQLQASSREIALLREHLERLEMEASLDGLTGIANRKRFDASLREAMGAANRDQTNLALLMVDIDYFKRFNDTHGHLLGDQVLKLVARYLTDCIKGNDLAARYGGEEFGVILPRTRLEDAIAVAEQIRSHVASKKVVNRRTGQALGQVTLSLGAAEYRRGETAAELIHRADEALYLAKGGGRNRVMSESNLPAKV